MLNGKGLATIAAAMMAGIGMGGASVVTPLQSRANAEYRPTRYPRTSAAIKHKPAGSKLARKAAEGTVGLARLR